MIEIRYGSQYEVADLTGRSVREARELFKDEMGIPDRAPAKLNGKKVKGNLEAETTLSEADTVSFARPVSRGAFLIGALLMALVITGGVFAYGYTTASTDLDVTAQGADFAAISENNSSPPDWDVLGFFKGTTGGGTLFDVNTQTANYTGDFTVTVSLANGDELVEVYRVLAMFIEMRDSSNNLVDVNGDGANTTDDFALLTLGNGAVNLFVTQSTADNYVVRVKSGFYISNVWGTGWSGGYEDPLLYAEVAQR